MKRLLRELLVVLLLMFMWSTFAVYAGTLSCVQCGMDVDLNSKYAAKIVQGETTSYFCDIGDLFAYLNAKGVPNAGAMVKDYDSGGWIDVTKAFYVRAVKKFSTPMGWGVAAFRDRKHAAEFGEVMDVDGARTILK